MRSVKGAKEETTPPLVRVQMYPIVSGMLIMDSSIQVEATARGSRKILARSFGLEKGTPRRCREMVFVISVDTEGMSNEQLTLATGCTATYYPGNVALRGIVYHTVRIECEMLSYHPNTYAMLRRLCSRDQSFPSGHTYLNSA